MFAGRLPAGHAGPAEVLSAARHDFYADGRSVRPQVENTVARGQLHEDTYFYTGLVGGKEGDAMPFPVTMEVLERGQERYNVYCTPCHSRVGNGAGMIVQRGYRRRATSIRAPDGAPLGHFFNVITNGYGAMPDYSAQVTPADRWAIVAYIKALQLSQNAKPAMRRRARRLSRLPTSPSARACRRTFADEWALPPTAVYGTPNNRTTAFRCRWTPAPNGKAPGRMQPNKQVDSNEKLRRLETHGIWTRTTRRTRRTRHHGPRVLPASLAAPRCWRRGGRAR
jgi:ribosomal protein L21E